MASVLAMAWSDVLQGGLIVIWVACLLFLLAGGLFLNLLGLAGNWVMLGSMGVHRWAVGGEGRLGVGWSTLMALLLLVALGEALEFFAGVLGAGKAGGSRRAVVLSMIGGLVGASLGFGAGNAVAPVVGGMVGVLLLSAGGALAGAVLGETWKGRSLEESLEVGRGAFVGRLLGTLSKTLVGAAMFVIALGALMVGE